MSDLILFEDDHLLVINKPAGMNTHSPSPFAGEGIYEWLKNREPRWASLAIIHRLDKETSGIIVFGKSSLANRSLTEQFTEHTIRKKYLLLTDQQIEIKNFVAKSTLVRAGEKYLSRPLSASGEKAETHFCTERGGVLAYGSGSGNLILVKAEPITGKTHQIRIHAAEHGFPILGDSLYGGTTAVRVFLHAHELRLRHPASGHEMTFTAPAEFEREPRFELRRRLVGEQFSESRTDAFRVIHGAADGMPGLYVERLGDFLLSQSESLPDEKIKNFLGELLERAVIGASDGPLRGVYHRMLNRRVRGASVTEASPQLLLGQAAPDEIIFSENGVQFTARFNEGYSIGLFLDQRDNRRRLLTGYIAPDFFLRRNERDDPLEILNTFAYTCGFSVSAAKAGDRVTSLDLSKKYLEWGKRNFTLNELDPDRHDFIFGDVFDWLRRLAKKKRQFDVVLLDPPTFSQSKEHGVFRAEKDYGELVAAALVVLKTNGILFASTNAEELRPEKFLEVISSAVVSGKRKIIQSHFIPQPPDFPISRSEPAHLKTVWLKIL